jgi:hypothetical protein
MINFKFLWRLFLCLCLLSFNSLVLAEYVKVSNSGKALSVDAKLGVGPDDWACTYDSKTKLIWEVKTTDAGLRDQKWTYTWYDSNSSDGNKGTSSGTINCQTGGRCDTEKFTQDVNAQGLCGSNDWRMPTLEELMNLVYCSNGQYAQVTSGQYGHICPSKDALQKPTINSIYFPNTVITEPYYGWFWSSAPNQNKNDVSWEVSFNLGIVAPDFKSTSKPTRLVRNGQFFDPSVVATNNTSAKTQQFFDNFSGNAVNTSDWSYPTGNASYYGRTQIRAKFPTVSNGFLHLQLDILIFPHTLLDLHPALDTRWLWIFP